MKRYLRIIGIISVMLLMFIFVAQPISAATTAVVTVTYTPKFLAISVSPTTWTVNDIVDGDGFIEANTTYYANPLGDTTAPTGAGAVDAECQFTITNTSNVITDLKVTSADASGGTDPMDNSNTGSGDTGKYGMKSYFSGQATGDWVISKSTGTAVALASLAATTDVKFGMIFATQTDAIAGGTASSFTITVSTAEHT